MGQREQPERCREAEGDSRLSGVERLRQTTSRTTITMHVTSAQTHDMAMLARSKAIRVKKIELSTMIGKIAPVIQLAGIEGTSPLPASFRCVSINLA